MFWLARLLKPYTVIKANEYHAALEKTASSIRTNSVLYFFGQQMNTIAMLVALNVHAPKRNNDFNTSEKLLASERHHISQAKGKSLKM